MPLTQRFDRLLLGAAVLQVAVGLALLASASWVIATERYHRDGSHFVVWQGATAMLGLAVLVAAMHLRLDLLADRRVVRGMLVAAWLLLVGPLLQAPVNATHRWLSVGGLSVQPSVFARLALILLVAVELERSQREGWPGRRLLVLAAAIGGTVALVIIEPDFGSSALILVVVAAMAFVAGAPLRLLAAPGAVAVVGLVVAVMSSPYRRRRVLAFLDPDGAADVNWQTSQSLIALGSGGLLGKGYGAGLQKLFFLPEPHTDFILAIAGEELGLLGVLSLIGLMAIIAWRGLRIAARQQVTSRALLAFGLTIAFAFQCLMHMAVCLDLVPPKGIPLPLISYGKTDLLVAMASVGLLLNLSREVRA
jgi:cell division protein FtsW